MNRDALTRAYLDRLIDLKRRVLLAREAGMQKELTYAEKVYAQHVAELADYLRGDKP